MSVSVSCILSEAEQATRASRLPEIVKFAWARLFLNKQSTVSDLVDFIDELHEEFGANKINDISLHSLRTTLVGKGVSKYMGPAIRSSLCSILEESEQTRPCLLDALEEQGFKRSTVETQLDRLLDSGVVKSKVKRKKVFLSLSVGDK